MEQRKKLNIGVYKIRNIINDDCYIGSTSNSSGFNHRWRTHIYALNHNKHHSIILQRAWNKYGKDNFIFEIIEECLGKICIEREQFYMDTIRPKYNIQKCAKNNWRPLDARRLKRLKNTYEEWLKQYSPCKNNNQRWIKLSQWAKLQGLPYDTVWRWWKSNKLPLTTNQMPSGMILVKI